MKPGGGSGLNPEAAAYAPFSKRDVGDSTHPNVADGYGVEGKDSSQTCMPKTATSSEKQVTDEDLEMDIDTLFLSETFSDLSYESIIGVYLANDRDLDATIEMLNDLEILSNEAEGYLPDTLDSGDVPETIDPSTSSAPKQTNASTEASTSTSSPTPNAPSS